MIITKKKISRRTVLRGMGVDVGVAAARRNGAGIDRVGKDRGEAVNRFGAVYVPNGMIMKDWLPAAEGAGFRVHALDGAAGAIPRPAARAEQSELRADGRPARRRHMPRRPRGF